MKIMVQAIVIGLATVVGMLGGCAVTWRFVASTDNCPPQVTCDAGGMAGAALGVLVSPFTGLLCGWLAIRYFQRRRADATRTSSTDR